MEKQTPTLGIVIKEIIQEKGLQNNFVAKKLGVSPSTLSKYKSGDRSIKADMIPSIADALGVSVDFIMQKMLTIRQQSEEEVEEKEAG